MVSPTHQRSFGGSEIELHPVPSRSTSVLQAQLNTRDVSSSDPPTAAAEGGPTSGLEVVSNFRKVVICAACFTGIFTACGTMFSFGVFQELYESMSKEPNNPFSGASPAAIDLIGTLAVAFQTIAAPFATAWSKKYSPRLMVSCGGIAFALACVLASFSQHLWQFILTQGFLLGLGTCFTYMPAATIAPTWYGPRRGLAMGIIMAGTGIGGLVWAPAIHALNEHLGFRNALRISGGISGALIVCAAIPMDWDPVTKARLQVEKETGIAPRHLWNIPLLDWRIAKTRKFTSQFLGAGLQSAAYYTPVFFFSAYARSLGYSSSTGANFIAINNACNAIGKIGMGLLADRFGRKYILFITVAISAISSFAFWLPSSLAPNIMTGRGLFITYSILYGIFASAYVSLFPTTLVELFGPAHFAGVNGFLYMARGLATLVGTPVAGALIRSSGDQLLPEGYWRMTLMVGTLLAGSAVALIL